MLKYISESIHEISALNKKNQRRVSCLNYCHGTDSVLDRFSVNEQVTKQAVIVVFPSHNSESAGV